MIIFRLKIKLSGERKIFIKGIRELFTAVLLNIYAFWLSWILEGYK